MRQLKKHLFMFFFSGFLLTGYAEEISFARDSWKPADWIMVKSPRWPCRGSWSQHEDHIANTVPADATPAEWQGKRVQETYTSMLRNTPVKGDFELSSTMEFTYRMAPLLVLAAPVGKSPEGYPEYREHWEVVLYDRGINVWHHNHKDGKPFWYLAASVKHPFHPDRKYELKLSVKHTPYGAKITVSCEDTVLIYTEHDLPETVFAGITGCEGLNNFYDFKLVPGRKR